MASLREYPHLAAALTEMANEIGRNYADTLGLNAHDATRTLSNMAKDATLHKIRVEGDDFVVTFDLPSYWKYVENGTRPHWPPKEPIDKWIDVKPVIPRPGKNGKLPTPDQLSYLIRRKISVFGTKGTHDLEKSVQASVGFWEQRITLALAKDVETIMKVDFDSIFKDVYGS